MSAPVRLVRKGQHFGKLTVERVLVSAREPQERHQRARCRCECGKLATVLVRDLESGRVKVCPKHRESHPEPQRAPEREPARSTGSGHVSRPARGGRAARPARSGTAPRIVKRAIPRWSRVRVNVMHAMHAWRHRARFKAIGLVLLVALELLALPVHRAARGTRKAWHGVSQPGAGSCSNSGGICRDLRKRGRR